VCLFHEVECENGTDIAFVLQFVQQYYEHCVSLAQWLQRSPFVVRFPVSRPGLGISIIYLSNPYSPSAQTEL
jgi:hypothetical protein